MKKYILASLVTLLTSYASAFESIKTCSFKIQIPGQSEIVPTDIEVLKEGKVFLAKTKQLVNGKERVLATEVVEISEHAVRAGLTAEATNMNFGEQMVGGTIGYLNDPEIGSLFSVGLDLKAIRKAKVYQIGKFTHMGGMVIVEAYDQNGQNLGSFISGFMPFACTK